MSRTIIKVPIEYLPMNSKNIPLFLPLACDFLKAGATTVGIFRVPGSKDQVYHINEALAQHVPYIPQNARIADVASFIKFWLLGLPKPLIDPEIYNEYFTSQTKNSIVSLVDHMPIPNRRSLALLISLLNVIIRHSEQNKMPMKNLATCFIPALTQSFKDLKRSFPFEFIVTTLISMLDESETDFITFEAVARIPTEPRSMPPTPRQRDSVLLCRNIRHRKALRDSRVAESVCLSQVVF
ncbi:RhoGAP domain containing protein [Histomonas meleagridis]|uniref:RhoGAP domain containing protein n=1 Tax=Histomonas meleagridis TaxID=135588 RepID=UPI00355AB11D|nr:RhoGAP domain containing protein [Histomonas meleagridis]KAH0801927.1 RhoGAP domain containing protein [Histomonas meleagridis]